MYLLDTNICVYVIRKRPEAVYRRLSGAARGAVAIRGEKIGAHDMLIAAHALALEATLVTNNEKEFRRIKGLKIENWAS